MFECYAWAELKTFYLFRYKFKTFGIMVDFTISHCELQISKVKFVTEKQV